MKLIDKNSHTSKTVYDHIRELQMRLLASVIALIAGGLVVYAFYEPILDILSAPLGAPLYYSNPAGGFAFIMKICFTGGLIIAMPVLIYNLIMFIKPAFNSVVPTKLILRTTAYSSILSVLGVLFAYFSILPGTLHFFSGFQVSGLSALISADDYLAFVTNILITFIVMFQIPLLIVFIDTIKPLQPLKLIKMEKWVILGSLVIALIVPFTYEFVTSLLIAVPIVGLYNISLAIIYLRHRKRSLLVNVITIDKQTPLMQSDILMDDAAYLSFADEIMRLEKPTVPILYKETRRTCMDISRTLNQNKAVQPASWVLERKQKRAAIIEQMRAFSEAHKDATVKRVVVS